MTAAPETRGTRSAARTKIAGNCRKRCPKFHKIHRHPQGLWKLWREDSGRKARQESMLRLAVTFVILIALAGALADLARGRRPLLLG